MGIYIVLVLCLGIALYWAILEAQEDNCSWVYHILWGFPYKLFIGFVTFGILTIVISTMHSENPNKISRTDNVNIYSIGLNNSVYSNFVLGCGSVNGKSTYRFLVKESNGYRCYEVDADKTLIVETDSTDIPHISYIIERYYTGEANWLMTFYFGDNDGWRKDFISKGKDNIIYVPKGSVVQSYEIKP